MKSIGNKPNTNVQPNFSFNIPPSLFYLYTRWHNRKGMWYSSDTFSFEPLNILNVLCIPCFSICLKPKVLLMFKMSCLPLMVPQKIHLYSRAKDLCMYTLMMRSVKTGRCRKMQNWVFGLILKLKVSSSQNCLNFVSMTFTSKVIIKWCWVVLYCYILVFLLFQAISQNVHLWHPMGFPKSHHIYVSMAH